MTDDVGQIDVDAVGRLHDLIPGFPVHRNAFVQPLRLATELILAGQDDAIESLGRGRVFQVGLERRDRVGVTFVADEEFGIDGDAAEPVAVNRIIGDDMPAERSGEHFDQDREPEALKPWTPPNGRMAPTGLWGPTRPAPEP